MRSGVGTNRGIFVRDPLGSRGDPSSTSG